MTITANFALHAPRTHESRIKDWIEQQEDVPQDQIADAYYKIASRLSAVLQRMVNHADKIEQNHKAIMHPYSRSSKGQQKAQEKTHLAQRLKMADHKHLMGSLKDWSDLYMHQARIANPAKYGQSHTQSIEPKPPAL